MDYSAYTEKNIWSFNGKLKGLPKMLSPLIGRTILFVAVIGIFVTVYIFIFTLLATLYHPLALVGVVLFFPACIGLWILLGRLTKSGNDYALRMALFAERNNFSYDVDGGPFKNKGSISSVLGEPMTSNMVAGKLDTVPFRLFTTYGRGFFIVLSLGLPNKYPHMLLDSKSNNLVVSNLLEKFPKDELIKLEGDFDKYFKLYSAGSSTETLQILSPELMSRVIDYAKNVDIEIVEDQLHIVINFKRLTEPVIRMLFEAASQILKDIGASSNNSRVKFDTSKTINVKR